MTTQKEHFCFIWHFVTQKPPLRSNSHFYKTLIYFNTGKRYVLFIFQSGLTYNFTTGNFHVVPMTYLGQHTDINFSLVNVNCRYYIICSSLLNICQIEHKTNDFFWTYTSGMNLYWY